MPREFSRTRRVGEQIQRELSGMIQREVKDPRVGWVTVTGVEVSRDMAHARVYVSVLSSDPGPGQDVGQVVTALNHASGFLRRRLSQTLVMRTIPQLHFQHDVSIERGSRLSSLIDQALAEDEKKGGR
ncbi:MAG: ribosome-binding factor A [Chromatiales bacterium 21-64-14]|nr:MAG: ribosome-binding factor A [Chromatiales bacterium 21-64-14]HQU16391.1 30S ribosome-binding factor RbfA [Gammaproteobacteria bacterium]